MSLLRSRLTLPLAFIFFFSTLAEASSAGLHFCKCSCFSNSTIIPLNFPTDPANPCTTCTRQFCLDQKLAICRGAQLGDEDLDTGTGQGGDVSSRCFQRDTFKDQAIIVSFLVITSLLLLGAAVKDRINLDRFPLWQSLKSHPALPAWSRQREPSAVYGMGGFGMPASGGGGYERVDGNRAY